MEAAVLVPQVPFVKLEGCARALVRKLFGGPGRVTCHSAERAFAHAHEWTFLNHEGNVGAINLCFPSMRLPRGEIAFAMLSLGAELRGLQAVEIPRVLPLYQASVSLEVCGAVGRLSWAETSSVYEMASRLADCVEVESPSARPFSRVVDVALEAHPRKRRGKMLGECSVRLVAASGLAARALLRFEKNECIVTLEQPMSDSPAEEFLEVTVVLASFRLTADDIASLRPGSTIRIKGVDEAQVCIEVGRRRWATAALVREGGGTSLNVLELLPPESLSSVGNFSA